MFGIFQQSSLRIEIAASGTAIRDSLIRPAQFQQWLSPQQFSAGLPETLTQGLTFTSHLGPIAVQHQVDRVEDTCLRLLLSQGVDGFHEWYWGEGWVQSRLEGISVLPLNLAQTLNLLRLRAYLGQAKVA
ncbi:hypothetical protein [Trichothermofontia sp.]